MPAVLLTKSKCSREDRRLLSWDPVPREREQARWPSAVAGTLHPLPLIPQQTVVLDGKGCDPMSNGIGTQGRMSVLSPARLLVFSSPLARLSHRPCRPPRVEMGAEQP